MQPSPNDAAYVDLVKQATAIFARDLPEITLVEETQTLVYNTTYWKGWPSAANPYMASFIPWEGFARVVQSLEATQ